MIRPDESRFSIRVRPTLFGASVAPIKAIFLGSSMDRRIGRRSRTAVWIDVDLWVARLAIPDNSTCSVRLRLVNNWLNSDELSLSVKTVGTYRTRIVEKLKLRNNAEIMRYVLIKGIATVRTELASGRLKSIKGRIQ